MISSISKIEALLTGITRAQLNKLPHDQAVRFARASAHRRRGGSSAGPTTQDHCRMIEAARAACSVLNTDGVLGQLRMGEHAENSDEVRCARPKSVRKSF
jgi:hypothetical protein